MSRGTRTVVATIIAALMVGLVATSIANWPPVELIDCHGKADSETAQMCFDPTLTTISDLSTGSVRCIGSSGRSVTCERIPERWQLLWWLDWDDALFFLLASVVAYLVLVGVVLSVRALRQEEGT